MSDTIYGLSNPAFQALKPDLTYIRKISDAILHPGWYKNARGFAEAKKLAAKTGETILLACMDYGCCEYWSDCLKHEVFDQGEFGWWVFRKGLILVELDCASLMTATYDSETADIIFKYFLADSGPNYWSVYMAAAARIDSDGETCLGRLDTYQPGTGVKNWIAEFENATSMNKGIIKLDKSLFEKYSIHRQPAGCLGQLNRSPTALE